MEMVMNGHNLSAWFFIAMMGAIGLVCLFLPVTVQSGVKKLAERGMLSGGAPVKGFVLSSGYLFSLRAIGVLALMAGLLLAWVTFKPR